MPEWMQTPFQADAELSLSMLVVRLVWSLALGCVVAAVYRFTHGGPGGQSRSLMATLVLLTVLICMMTLVIGNNVARAFSLVGALAIVAREELRTDREVVLEEVLKAGAADRRDPRHAIRLAGLVVREDEDAAEVDLLHALLHGGDLAVVLRIGAEGVGGGG